MPPLMLVRELAVCRNEKTALCGGGWGAGYSSVGGGDHPMEYEQVLSGRKGLQLLPLSLVDPKGPPLHRPACRHRAHTSCARSRTCTPSPRGPAQ